eukprot:1160840-Pelagomonas_calceolata.AAC.2
MEFKVRVSISVLVLGYMQCLCRAETASAGPRFPGILLSASSACQQQGAHGLRFIRMPRRHALPFQDQASKEPLKIATRKAGPSYEKATGTCCAPQTVLSKCQKQCWWYKAGNAALLARMQFATRLADAQHGAPIMREVAHVCNEHRHIPEGSSVACAQARFEEQEAGNTQRLARGELSLIPDASCLRGIQAGAEPRLQKISLQVTSTVVARLQADASIKVPEQNNVFEECGMPASRT